MLYQRDMNRRRLPPEFYILHDKLGSADFGSPRELKMQRHAMGLILVAKSACEMCGDDSEET
jgi:hypothetical protein